MKCIWSLNQIFQLILSIGPWGYIIPNEDRICQFPRHDSSSPDEFVEVKNPTRLVINAAMSAMTYANELMRESWTKTLCAKNRIRARTMQTDSSILFQTALALEKNLTEDEKK